jgi:cell division septum initiation protein DivIVA
MADPSVKDLAKRLDALEKKDATHDKRWSALGDAISDADTYAANINEARKAGDQELHKALAALAERVKALEGAKKP